MGQLEKLRQAFKECDGPFKWRDFERLLHLMGFRQLKPGKTGGSRRRFLKESSGRILMMHEPHDGLMKPLMVRGLREQLEQDGEL